MTNYYHLLVREIENIERIKGPGSSILINVLMGQPPEASRSELARPAPLSQAPRLVAIGKPEELLRRRSDIRVAERSLAVATAQIGIFTADLFPQLVGRNSEAYSAAIKIVRS